MKVDVKEHDGCFSIDLFAETLPEAALLTRMGVDARKHINHIAALVNRDSFQFDIVLSKSRKANNWMPRRK